MSAIFLMLFIGHPGSSLPPRLSLAVRERLAAGPSRAAGLGLWELSLRHAAPSLGSCGSWT